MANLLKDQCTVGNLNDIYAGKCVFDAKTIRGHLVTQNLNHRIALDSLTLSDLREMIKNRTLFVLKGFKASEGEVSGIQTGNTGYGNTIITSRGGNANITYDYPYTLCTFRELQNWHNVKVAVYPIDDAGRIGGRLVNEGGVFYLKPIVSTYGVLESLPFKFSADEVVTNPLTWIADTIKLDHFQELEFDLNDIDGITPVEIEVTDVQATEITINVTAGCNGTPVSGLESLLQVVDSNGDVVSTTITETSTLGTYTISGLTTATDYAVNLTNEVVEDVLNTLYGALSENLSFTTA